MFGLRKAVGGKGLRKEVFRPDRNRKEYGSL
jgi:hypothetical protein